MTTLRQSLSGMVQISLDSQGRLYHLEAMPPEKESSSAPFAPFNWNVLFQSAGLNQAQFQSTHIDLEFVGRF